MQVKGYDKAPLSLSAVASSEGARCSLSLSKVFLELVERGLGATSSLAAFYNKATETSKALVY